MKDDCEDVAEEDADVEGSCYVKNPFPCPLLQSIDVSK